MPNKLRTRGLLIILVLLVCWFVATVVTSALSNSADECEQAKTEWADASHDVKVSYLLLQNCRNDGLLAQQDAIENHPESSKELDSLLTFSENFQWQYGSENGWFEDPVMPESVSEIKEDAKNLRELAIAYEEMALAIEQRLYEIYD